KTEFEGNKQYAQNLLSKNTQPSKPPEDTFAKPLRDLVENDSRTPEEEKKFQQFKRIVTSDWWAAMVAAKENTTLTGSDKEKLDEHLEMMLKASPWDELVKAVECLGLDKFKIKGESK